MFKKDSERKEFSRCPVTGIGLTPMLDSARISVIWRNGEPTIEVVGMNIEGCQTFQDLYLAANSLFTHAALSASKQQFDYSQIPPTLYRLDA